MTDEEIITGCKKENRTAQKALYQKYKGILFAICLRYGKNKTEAEDFLQEGMIRVFNNIHQFKNQGSFEGWLKRIVVNTTLRQLKVNARLDTYNTDWQDAPQPSHDRFRDKLGEEEILEYIQMMPDGYRTVFNMFAIEGYSHKEIAEMLNISEGTSRSQYSRAKSYLQNLLLEKTK